jgi:ATP-binding cassette subfamily C (CFTR/MRP) protein 1
VGETVNLMSIDTQRIMDVILSLNLLWSSPLTIGLSIYSLWAYLGPSALAGLAVMILLIPVNAWLSARMKKFQIANMRYKDQRMKAMNEVLEGVKVLKLYAWEPSFEQQVNDIRDREVDNLKQLSYLGAVQTFLFNATPFFVALASFATFVLVDPVNNVLDAAVAFVSISYFNIIRRPLNQLPSLVVQMISATVSLDRLNGYLNAKELPPDNVTHYSEEGDNLVVSVTRGHFSWDAEAATGPTLQAVELAVRRGELVAVVGQVGAGKSSLLSALIGDMERVGAACKVNVQGRVAYVAQQAWMQNASLEYNITFGKPFQVR